MPHQVARQAENARALLKAAETPTPSPAPAATPAPAKPATTVTSGFTYDELLSPPNAERAASLQYWRDRANVLQGIRLEEQRRSSAKDTKIGELEEKVASLEAKNLELVRTAATEATQPPMPSPVPPPGGGGEVLKRAMMERFTADEIEMFGEERAMVMTRQALQTGATIEAAFKELRKQVDTLIERLATATPVKSPAPAPAPAATPQETPFQKQLSELFPTWRQTNVDPRWRAWLEQADEHTGLMRDDLLQMHAGKGDAVGVVRMLNAFVQSLGTAAPSPPPPETPPALPGGDGGTPSTPALGTDLPLLTEAEVREGFRKISLTREGQVLMTPDEEKLFRARVKLVMEKRGRA